MSPVSCFCHLPFTVPPLHPLPLPFPSLTYYSLSLLYIATCPYLSLSLSLFTVFPSPSLPFIYPVTPSSLPSTTPMFPFLSPSLALHYVTFLPFVSLFSFLLALRLCSLYHLRLFLQCLPFVLPLRLPSLTSCFLITIPPTPLFPPSSRLVGCTGRLN